MSIDYSYTVTYGVAVEVEDIEEFSGTPMGELDNLFDLADDFVFDIQGQTVTPILGGNMMSGPMTVTFASGEVLYGSKCVEEVIQCNLLPSEKEVSVADAVYDMLVARGFTPQQGILLITNIS